VRRSERARGARHSSVRKNERGTGGAGAKKSVRPGRRERAFSKAARRKK
jgi:hypothetical protein